MGVTKMPSLKFVPSFHYYNISRFFRWLYPHCHWILKFNTCLSDKWKWDLILLTRIFVSEVGCFWPLIFLCSACFVRLFIFIFQWFPSSLPFNEIILLFYVANYLSTACSWSFNFVFKVYGIFNHINLTFYMLIFWPPQYIVSFIRIRTAPFS